jgi:uncharacterized protein involved in outer membrane biogenesis
MKKTILMIFSGIIIFGIVAIVFVLSQLDNIVSNLIEKYGSAITGVNVNVSSIEISPANGEGKVSRLTIGNPPGYKSDYALIASQIDVKTKVKTFLKDVVVIDRIDVANPKITYELGSGRSNYQTIQRNVDNYQPKKAKSKEGGKKVQINNLNVTGGKITVSAPTLNQNFEVDLPDIHLSNLGQNGSGGNVDQVTQQVMDVITDAVMKEVGKITLENFGNFMLNSSGGVLQGTGEGLKGIGEGIEGVTKGIFGGGSGG